MPTHEEMYRFRMFFNIPNFVFYDDLVSHIIPTQTTAIRKVFDSLLSVCIPQVQKIIPITTVVCTPKNEAFNSYAPNYAEEFMNLFFQGPEQFCAFEMLYSFATNRIVGYVNVVSKGLSKRTRAILSQILINCFGPGYDARNNIIRYAESFYHQPRWIPQSLLRSSMPRPPLSSTSNSRPRRRRALKRNH